MSFNSPYSHHSSNSYNERIEREEVQEKIYGGEDGRENFKRLYGSACWSGRYMLGMPNPWNNSSTEFSLNTLMGVRLEFYKIDQISCFCLFKTVQIASISINYFFKILSKICASFKISKFLFLKKQVNNVGSIGSYEKCMGQPMPDFVHTYFFLQILRFWLTKCA